jgi:NADPH:quinone reductase-like Zn-dependent oxidoreductase
MKAIIYTTYGPPDVLLLTDVATPRPNDDEVLIRVRAASLNPVDWHFMRGAPYGLRIMTGLRKPKLTRLGNDVAGQVEAVGKSVTKFKPGDAVFGTCKGAFAEYACASERTLALKPANASFEQAAAMPIAALSALQGLRDKGRIQAGQKVLINGAAGGVGTFAVQMARVFGADVTGVCSTRNVELVRSLGAHHEVDYTRDDFTRSGERYDLILDCIGNRSLADRRRALSESGALVMIGGPNEGRWIGSSGDMFNAAVLSLFVKQNLLPFLARLHKDDLVALQELFSAGKIRSVIDRTYPLSEVPAAIRYLEEGHARGKVVIAIAS